jgi:hypothetical protein
VDTWTPERASAFDRWLALAVAGALAVSTVAWAGTAVGPWWKAVKGDRATVVLAAIVWGRWATRRAMQAWAMWRGPGRYVFVDDHQRVPHTGGVRIRWPWNWSNAGHWIHLTDARSERSLGWIEVPPGGAVRLEAAGVAALFGDCSRSARSVLTGPFRPVRPIGRTHPELPEPYFLLAGRASRRLWRLPRGPRPSDLEATAPPTATD